MAAILLAFEENKVKQGGDKKQDFGKFLQEFVAEKHEDDSDVEEDVDDPEDPGKINREIGKKICIHFKTFIDREKKPVRNDVKPFLTVLSNDYPEKEIKSNSIRDYVWNIVQTKKKKAKSAETQKAEKEEKPRKAKPGKEKKKGKKE